MFNRHSIACFIISAPIPFLGFFLAVWAGKEYERITHGGTIPDDPDTLQDIADDKYGAYMGQIFSVIVWGILIAYWTTR